MGNQKTTNEYLYQKVLDLTLQWGEDWKDVIKDRLKQLHPDVLNEEIEMISMECKKIRKHGMILRKQQVQGKISPAEFGEKLKSHYPQLSNQNITNLAKDNYSNTKSKKAKEPVTIQKETPKGFSMRKLFHKFPFSILFKI